MRERETAAVLEPNATRAQAEEATAAAPIATGVSSATPAEFVAEIRRLEELNYRQIVRDAVVGTLPTKDDLLRSIAATGRAMIDFENDTGMMLSRVEAAAVLAKEHESNSKLREIEKQNAELLRQLNEATEAYNAAAQAYELANGEYISAVSAENAVFSNARSKLAATRDKSLIAQLSPLQNEHSLLGQKLRPGVGYDEPAAEEAALIKNRMAELEAEMAAIAKRLDCPTEMDFGRAIPDGPS